MNEDISYKRMYQLINEALSECYNDDNISVNSQIHKFQQQHWQVAKSNRQLNVFDEPVPSAKEVYHAVDFCDLLDDYRISVDVFNEQDVNLGADFYRQLYQGIERYRPYINNENKTTLKSLERSIRKKIPEFRLSELLVEYNERALEVLRLKKDYEKNKHKNPNTNKFHEQKADILFRDILQKKELPDIPPSVDKLTAYSNILSAVDCLPGNKYSRIKKYNLKYHINLAIVGICKHLGDNYFLAQTNASHNADKYLNAMHNTQKFSKNKQRSSTNFAREKRLHDDYYYK